MFPICSRMFLFDHVKLIHKSNIEIFRSTNFLAISNNNRIKYKEDRQITRLQNHSKKNTNPNTIKLYFNKNKIYFIIKDAIIRGSPKLCIGNFSKNDFSIEKESNFFGKNDVDCKFSRISNQQKFLFLRLVKNSFFCFLTGNRIKLSVYINLTHSMYTK